MSTLYEDLLDTVRDRVEEEDNAPLVMASGRQGVALLMANVQRWGEDLDILLRLIGGLMAHMGADEYAATVPVRTLEFNAQSRDHLAAVVSEFEDKGLPDSPEVHRAVIAYHATEEGIAIEVMKVGRDDDGSTFVSEPEPFGDVIDGDIMVGALRGVTKHKEKMMGIFADMVRVARIRPELMRIALRTMIENLGEVTFYVSQEAEEAGWVDMLPEVDK